MSPHDEMDHDELTPHERALLAALPREREPSRLLEERTVRALREHGAIRSEAAARPARAFRFHAGWLSGAVAAGIALFVGGLATGEYLGQRNANDLAIHLHRQDQEQAALVVQQTGSAYVGALSRLAQLSDTSRGAQGAQGREVASQVLRAAADEVVRMNPNDPVASGILAAFDRARTRRAAVRGDTTAKQSVVWF